MQKNCLQEYFVHEKIKEIACYDGIYLYCPFHSKRLINEDYNYLDYVCIGCKYNFLISSAYQISKYRFDRYFLSLNSISFTIKINDHTFIIEPDYNSNITTISSYKILLKISIFDIDFNDIENTINYIKKILIFQ